MAFPVEMMFESIWFQRQKYVEAENHYQLFLVNNISGALAEKHHNIKQEDIKCDKNQKSQQVCLFIINDMFIFIHNLIISFPFYFIFI